MFSHTKAGSVLLALFAATASAQTAPSVDPAKIEQVTGAKPSFNKDEGVYKVTFPRNDVNVTVDGNALPPFMGLTSWAAFTAGGKAGAMVMGDIVLFQDEVDPAMSTALDNGLAVTALHNHFFYDDPKVYFMHVGGEGTAEQLAGGVRKVLDRVREVRSGSPRPATGSGRPALPKPSAITSGRLSAALGEKAGKPAEKDGMVKYTIGRTVKMACGCEVGKEMGVNTWAAFMGGDDRAVVDGDFVTFEGELQPVLKALRAHDISVVAIHNHMEGDSPKAIFLHYWGTGPAERLATGVRAALDAQEKAHAEPARTTTEAR